MEYVGHAPGFERVVFRGDVAGREFVAFWLDGDNRVLAGMNVNIWDVLDDVKALIQSRAPVDVDKVCDPQSSLPDLPSVSWRLTASESSAPRRTGAHIPSMTSGRALHLQPLPFGAAAFDPQARIAGQGDQFVAGRDSKYRRCRRSGPPRPAENPRRATSFGAHE